MLTSELIYCQPVLNPSLTDVTGTNVNIISKVLSLVEKTVIQSESNSALIVGQRGSGKSAIVKQALQMVSEQNHPFKVIHLNGLIHTDDRSSLREIALQLDSGSSGRASLRTFAETLLHLLAVLQGGDRTGTPLIFILDEFDLFTQHPKQTLLYTLFDLVQSQPQPMAVFGITPRLDAVELLEKRVKSRFSHRQISVYPPAQFKSYLQVARNALEVGIHDSRNRKIASTPYRTDFNAVVSQLFEHSDFVRLLRRQFDFFRDISSLHRILIPMVAALDADSPYLRLDIFQASVADQLVDMKIETIQDISLLELCLIIAMKQYLDQGIIKFNFEMVYDEYKTLMGRSGSVSGSGMKLYKKAVALKAFEHLLALELIRPLESGGNLENDPHLRASSSIMSTAGGGSRLASSNILKEFTMVQLLLEPSHIEEAVLKYPDCPPLVAHWGTNAL
ncbi:origin recognition complex subunit 4 C-terminus-domain-containing protein [Dimargaris cristalligena]|uniref:Origin recognition complex subunit 4 n=1 Tax=Dimargaris cristalligena TaxID=215637 RepID=A0A4P9ZSV7_9FUNG|nr:origin recognition complex subunit 4 C-terminus-domain-containing protein [Dimargaris cristalligena]|eukprot:RKP36505.1 origin recognition complex subunit 4 C-terminus-domain-containing protein [Dimargaris cristalligena]